MDGFRDIQLFMLMSVLSMDWQLLPITKKFQEYLGGSKKIIHTPPAQIFLQVMEYYIETLPLIV